MYPLSISNAGMVGGGMRGDFKEVAYGLTKYLCGIIKYHKGMVNMKATMTDIRVIIREMSRGTSLREMERKLKLSRTSLRHYRDRAASSGRSLMELLALNDAELQAIMVKGDGRRSRDTARYTFLQDKVEEYARAMARRHMTYEILYEEYRKSTDAPYGYTQFKAIVQEYEKGHDYKYHNIHEPGREMQFDFAGDPLWIVDGDTGEMRKAVVLVCVLPYSMMSYVTALPSAKMEYLFHALSRAVGYFGGVAEITKTDNMRQWIRKTDRYEPALNEAASQWCLHYGTDMDGCRPGKPRDKGPAESLVNQAYKYYYGRLCRETFFSYEELNRRLDELNDSFNDRPRKNKAVSRREQYEKEELPHMLPLPPRPFLLKYTKGIKINSTYHFQVDRGHFYSVPYQHVGKKAKVVYDAETVEVWIGLDRVALHERKYTAGYSTIEAHMPEKHLAYRRSKDVNAAYFQSKASRIGPHTRASIDHILASALFVQQSYRSCQGVLRLALRYGPERLEAACSRIGPKSAATYKRIEAILKKNLDGAPPAPSDTASYMPRNEDVRGASAYQ